MAEAQPEKRCFVPNCECTNGVSFPTEDDTREKWLDGLNLKDMEPCDGDFVCLGHFNEKDLNDEYVPGKYGGYRSFVCWVKMAVVVDIGRSSFAFEWKGRQKPELTSLI